MQFQYITTLEQYNSALEHLHHSEELSADTETYALPEWGEKGSALDPHTGRISLLILKGRRTPPFVFDILHLQSLNCDWTPLQSLLSSRKFILFHNGKFDLKFIRSTFGFWLENVRDTMIMSKLIGNATGSRSARVFGHGYTDLCRDYLNVHIGGKKDLRQSTWYCALSSRNLENEWWMQKLTYAANDVQYLFKLYDIMLEVLTAPLPHSILTKSQNFNDEWGLNMEKQMQIDFEYIPVVAEMEYVGMPVSRDTLVAFQQGIEDKVNEVAVKLCQEFELDEPQPNWEGVLMPSLKALKILRSSKGLLELINKALKLKKIDNVQKKVLERLLSIIDALTVDKVEDVNSTQESTADISAEDLFINAEEEVLYGELLDMDESEIKSISPVVKNILDFKLYSKQASMNLKKFINPCTGRIHASVDTIGAATGRSAYSSPNVQQVTGKVKVVVTMDRKKAWLSKSRTDHFAVTMSCPQEVVLGQDSAG